MRVARLTTDTHSPNGLCSASTWCVATGSRPWRRSSACRPRDGEVRAVARDVEVIPARAAGAGLHAAEVGHADEQQAARRQPAGDPRQRGAGVVEVLEHVPQRGRVHRAGRDDRVLDAGLLQLDAARPRALTPRSDGSIPSRLPARRARLRDEAPAARADVEQPAGRPRAGAREQGQPAAVEGAQQRRGEPRAARRAAAVGAGLVRLGRAGASVTALPQRPQRASA